MMRKIDIQKLSQRYTVRQLEMQDVQMILCFCEQNTQYYEYCGKEPSVELIEQDLTVAPPGIPMAQKHYIGFFEQDRLLAVMDLVDGYPDPEYAFIGFFMMDSKRQGRGIGTMIISEALAYLRQNGFQKCRLGIDRDNPQSNHFWKKNGFQVIQEVEREDGTILVAEKLL